jgi:YD repeat-containing protein
MLPSSSHDCCFSFRGILLCLGASALSLGGCGGATANPGPGRFHRPSLRAPVCEIRTDEDGDGEVDSIAFDHYDRHERVAVEELDQDADGNVDVSMRFAYDGRDRLRRVETTAQGVTQTRALEYQEDDLVRETWTDAEGQRHVRLYGHDGRVEAEPVAGEERESVTMTYDAQGRVIAEDRRLPHGAHTYSSFTYDENGDRIGERVEQAGQPLACVVEFEHDSQHRLRRQVHHLEGTEPVVTTFTWRPDGTLAQSETRAGDVLRERVSYGEACRVRKVPERH